MGETVGPELEFHERRPPTETTASRTRRAIRGLDRSAGEVKKGEEEVEVGRSASEGDVSLLSSSYACELLGIDGRWIMLSRMGPAI